MMTGRSAASMVLMTALAGIMVAAPVFSEALAQAPVQLYPRPAPAAPPPSPEPAPPMTQPVPQPATPAMPLPTLAAPPTGASPPTAPRGIAVTPLPPAAPVPAQSAAVQPPPAPPQAPQAAPGQPSPGQPLGRDEVLAVVEGFYAALARGDGRLANDFLVPEKRNQGAYEIASMTRFYSTMSEPLRVIGIGRLDPQVVRVQYAYTHQSGRRCDGVADVTVHRVDGRALIDRIRALSGC